MQMPETHYARAGELRLAYHKWGEGPPLLIVPDLVSNEVVRLWHLDRREDQLVTIRELAHLVEALFLGCTRCCQ
jgi:hypothetical protein